MFKIVISWIWQSKSSFLTAFGNVGMWEREDSAKYLL